MKRIVLLLSTLLLLVTASFAAYVPVRSTEIPALIQAVTWNPNEDPAIYENVELRDLVAFDGGVVMLRVLYPQPQAYPWEYLKFDSFQVFDSEGREVPITYGAEDGWMEQGLLGWGCLFNVDTVFRGKYTVVLRTHWSQSGLPETTKVLLKVAP